MEKDNDNNNNETDSDEYLTNDNIIENDDKIKINPEDLNSERVIFRDFDKEELEIKEKNLNKQNISNNIKNKDESSDFNLLKKDSNETNLNINSILSLNIPSKLEENNSISYHGEDSSIFTNLNIDKKSENLNNSKQMPFNFKESNSYTYSESDMSLSKSNISINKKEDDSDININISNDLLSKFEKAFPELSYSSNEYKKIYKYIKNNNLDLTIFEIMNIIQMKISIKITENKYNNKYYNNEFQNYTYSLPIELIDIVDPVYINTEHLKIMKYYKTICIDDKNKYFGTKE